VRRASPAAWPVDTKVRHGTPSGHTLHQTIGSKPCDACTAAKREYDQRRRAADRVTALARARARAQNRARAALVERHATEYAELYAQFKAEESAALEAD
jgi:hypothetical protein